MRVLSRYTNQGEYKALAQKLALSCERFGLQASIDAVEAEETWAATANEKPTWILNALLNAREAILWLDADCEIVKLPVLLLGASVDIAAYNFAADPDNRTGVAYDPAKAVVTTGVLYVSYTAGAIELMLRWISSIARGNGEQTDPLFDEAFNTCRPPVRCLWLPKAYNRMDSMWPDVEPVINHAYRRGQLRGGEQQYG